MELDSLDETPLDVWLAAFAGALALPSLGDWLIGHPEATFWLLAALHLAMLPWMGAVLVAGQGQQDSPLLSPQSDPWNLFGWAGALYMSGGFVVPGVLGLTLVRHAHELVFLGIVFGPLALLALTLTVLLKWEARTGPKPMPQRTPRSIRLATAGIVWAYLTALEAALWAARGADHEVLSRGPLFFGLATLGYLPARLFLHASTRAIGWRTGLLVATFVWLLLRLI